jgi:hypothetical protein
MADDDCRIELHAAPPTDELVRCARLCTKVLSSLSDPSLEAVFTVISLMLVNVISNYAWPTLEARDMMPDLIAEQLKRNLARADDYDRRYRRQRLVPSWRCAPTAARYLFIRCHGRSECHCPAH